MGETALKKLTDILEQEREMLLSGAYEALEDGHAEKEALMEELDLREEPAEQVRGFAELLAHLQLLSGAALEGMRRAREGVEARAAARSQLATYDRDGAPRLIEAQVEESIRRA